MSTASPSYVRKLRHWDTRSSVRVKPRRLLRDEEAMGRVYFSPELVPIAEHPLVRRFGPEAVRQLQVRQLYRYLDFTTQLELEVVNTVAKEIALGKAGVELPDVMREDAFKLCTDEAHHAYFSEDMKRQALASTGITPVEEGTPSFLVRLRGLQADLPSEMVSMSELLFTVVSETLISSILAEIPKDPRVVTAVRQVVEDHAEDEGRHSAYFSQLFGCFWPHVTGAQRTALGPQLPHYILAFLEPDRSATRRALARLPLEDDEIEAVIDQTYPAATVASNARDAARVTLHLFENHGVLDDPRIGDEFRACGLI
jgi:hypothetical protein